MRIAIDGGVASGKSAVGNRLAQALGLPFVDTGLFYRAVTRAALDAGLGTDQAEPLVALARMTPIRIEGGRVFAGDRDVTDELYTPQLSAAVSTVSSLPGVREAVVPQQRALAGDGVVMAGRDIGTVVLPDADFKFFLTASLSERVRRRAAQLSGRGEEVGEEAMLREVEARDRADSDREVAPLRPAADAEVVDTDELDRDQVVALLLERVRSRRP